MDSDYSARISELESVLGEKYKIVRRIGLGGYGEVYLGEHSQLHRKVAIKFLSHGFATQADLVTRFHREAKSAAKLIHPNIIDIYDVGESKDTHYFVMKYIEGETLSQKMNREKKIAPGETIQIIKQLADALDYAHSNDVIHRDVKPSNVMIDAYGKPLLMDFGVARIQFEAKLTGRGRLVGTPHYLPPEQPLGNPIDGRSDIYSLGVLFYEMLSGSPPFHDDNSIALIFKHVHELPPSLRERSPELHPGLCEVVHKMMEKLPEKRPQTGSDVVDALEALADVYPQKVAMARRSAPSLAIYNTEKLLLLAREHIEKDKVSKAFQILTTVVKRHPEDEQRHREVQDMVRELIEKARDTMSHQDYRSAREICGRLQTLSSDNQEIVALVQEVEREERIFKAEQFRIHFEAAQFAIEQNDAASAVSHLMKCSALDPEHKEVQQLLDQTRERITSEIDLLCERLDFDTAEYMLYMGQASYPDLFQSKSLDLQLHRSIYQKLQNARELSKKQQWREAAAAYEQFLGMTPPSGFAVFQTLRTEAQTGLEDAQTNLQRSLMKKENDRFSLQRIIWILVVGIVSGGAIIALSILLRKQSEVPEPQTNLTFLRKLKTAARENKDQAAQAKKEQALVSLVESRKESEGPRRVLSIVSEPSGATILLNQKTYGYTPARIESLRDGYYHVILRKRGYEDYSDSVSFGKSKIVNVEAKLVPIRNKAPVSAPPPEVVIRPGMIVSLDSNVVPPKALKKSAATYPEKAKKQGIYGTVKLEILISETGSVFSVKIVQSAGPILDSAAVKTVKEWLYQPATKNGIPVSVWIPAAIHYAKP